VLVLKRDRTNADGVLFATGRDIEEVESALHFDRDTGLWSLMGSAEDFRKSEERRAVVDLLRTARGPMTPKEIAEALGRKHGTIKVQLTRMYDDCQVQKVGTGLYTVPQQQAPL
jgi:DNA-binding NarL/FixJ family response regulator